MLALGQCSRCIADSPVLFAAADTERCLTYAQVRQRSLAFAHSLRRKWDWQKGDDLVVFTTNSIDAPPVVWGTLAISGVVCPVNPNYRVEELFHPLRDTKARALVPQRAQAPVAFKAAERAGIPHDRVVVLDEVTEDDFDDALCCCPARGGADPSFASEAQA